MPAVPFTPNQITGRIVCLARRDRYLIISKDAIEDRRLSFRARGVHAYLMSKPEDWVVRDSELIKHVSDATKGEGRDAIRAALSELTDGGYFRRVRRRTPGGKFVYVTLIFESPRVFEQQFAQGHLFELFLQSIVPGSSPSDDDGPYQFSENGTAYGFSGSGVSAQKTVDWKTVDGQPYDGQPSTVNHLLLSPDLLKTESEQEEKRSAAGFAAQDSVGGEKQQRLGDLANLDPDQPIPPELIELETALLSTGIDGSMLRELLALYPTLTASFVNSEWERCKNRGKATGVLIANLRARAEARRRKLNIAAQRHSQLESA